MTHRLLLLKSRGGKNLTANVNENIFPYQQSSAHFCVKVTTSKFSQPLIMINDKTSTPKTVKRENINIPIYTFTYGCVPFASEQGHYLKDIFNVCSYLQKK